MWYVYFLKSKKIKNWIYVGSTNNLQRRTQEHKEGRSLSTKAYTPLYLASYVVLFNEQKARCLEKYFKKGSGKAILKKRILSDEAPSNGA